MPFGAFLLAVGLMELTPGPNMTYLAMVAARSGWRAGLVTIAGVTLAFCIYLAAALGGLLEVLTRWPWAYEALRWSGVAYLAWLALDAWRGSPAATSAPTDNSLFLRGLLNNVLNPKAAVLYIALLPGFVRPQEGHPIRQALALGAIHIGVSLLVHCAIVWTAVSARPAIEAWEARGARLGKVFALGLVGVAFWLAFMDRA